MLCFFSRWKVDKNQCIYGAVCVELYPTIFEARSWNYFVCSTLTKWKSFDKWGGSWSHLFSSVWLDKSNFCELLRTLRKKVGEYNWETHIANSVYCWMLLGSWTGIFHSYVRIPLLSQANLRPKSQFDKIWVIWDSFFKT